MGPGQSSCEGPAGNDPTLSTKADDESRVSDTTDPVHPRQYDIWWAALPDPAGRRPVLLLSRSSAFAYLTRLIVVEVTTTVRRIPQEMAIGEREGLTRPCVANLDAVRTIPKGCLDRRIGRIAQRRHVEVKRSLGHVLHWPELTVL